RAGTSRQQDQATARTWQDIQESIRPGSGYEQRKELLKRNPESTVRESGART
ncbi:hypothetical protein FRC07_014631, partial [Ceratobasidium sp. 392]